MRNHHNFSLQHTVYYQRMLIIVESQTNIKKGLLILHENYIDISLNYRQLLLKLRNFNLFAYGNIFKKFTYDTSN